MANLGSIPTIFGSDSEVYGIELELNIEDLTYAKIEEIDSILVLQQVDPTLIRTASVATYPYPVATELRQPLGAAPNFRPHRGRATMSIRGLAQNDSAIGVQRAIGAIAFDSLSQVPGKFIAATLSANSTGVFDIRVPDTAPTIIFLKPLDGGTKNAVILEDITPVTPV